MGWLVRTAGHLILAGAIVTAGCGKEDPALARSRAQAEEAEAMAEAACDCTTSQCYKDGYVKFVNWARANAKKELAPAHLVRLMAANKRIEKCRAKHPGSFLNRK